jgi:hypothetical protein
MNGRKRTVAVVGAAALGLTLAAPAFADDGYLVRKSMSHEGSTKIPPGQTDKFPVENEHAFINTMKFYVPMQAANGTQLGAVDYENIDEGVVDSRDLAKPLVGVYINGQVEAVEGTGFAGHGIRDAWGAISLDDGLTWKNTNLSESADESSSDVERKDVKLFKDTKYAYPGDVTNIFHAVAGDKALVAWPSKYCSSGQPNYSLDNEEPTPEQTARREAIAAYLGIDFATASPDDLYLIDMFGVGGQQGSVDYAEDRWEQNQPVGEVPYSCLWTARGQLVQGDDPRTEALEASYMRWFKAERLTSGRRDVNRIETQCVEGAGCAITWQEDPDGLRPGQGEGPGEGWSGAIANSQTDVWYSYVDWANFNVVQDPNEAAGDVAMDFSDYETTASAGDVTQKPKAFVPFAMPMRMTDNAKCNVMNPQPYCYGSALEGYTDANGSSPAAPVFPDADATPMAYGLRDMCADTVEIETGRNDELTPVCVTEDGLPLVGNTASTRPRLNLFGYDADPKDEVDGFDSAFAVVVAEEDKGLGSFGFVETTDGDYDATQLCDPETADNCIAFDEGKNMWYHTFGMSLVDSVASDPVDGLLKNLGFHGNMLNQPEVNWQTGEFYPVANTEYMWDFGDYDYDIYATEIARRGSLLAQDIAKADEKDDLLALPTWKQGSMNQGGPADVMSRRILLPKKNWDVTKDGNPYAFRNMACENLLYGRDKDGRPENPNYPDGLCTDSAISMSATVPDTAVKSDTEDTTPLLPELTFGESTFAKSDTNPVLQGSEVDPNTTKVLSWHQCQPGGQYTDADGALTDCPGADGDESTTLDDQSWYNPYDVAKGHRGFLDGDFVMMLYAWSPNWRLNTVGHDRYELYIRRSFDGGLTWTTLPASFTASDGNDYAGAGTTTCETFRSTETGTGEPNEPQACTAYAAGVPEQARNVTQHQSMRTTTLDPRYTPTAASITADPWGVGVPNYGDDEDVRDPSRYFVVYETGDNTTTAAGEPEPLDLFYSRAVDFGDNYEVWAETEDGGLDGDVSQCYPNNPQGDDTVSTDVADSGFCNEFDQMEQGIPGLEASEASLTANPGGEFLYGAWAQFQTEVKNKNKTTVDSDAMARRVWWIADYRSTNPDNVWTLKGTSGPGTTSDG